MDKLIINHTESLNGVINISGSKNSTLPIMAATLLAAGKYKLSNVPALKDIFTMAKVLSYLGCITSYNKIKNELLINTENLNSYTAPYELVKTMRASFLVSGPLLTRFKKAIVSLPGGCAIGARPVNIHLEGLTKLGATTSIKKGYVNIKTKKKLIGCEIILNFPSVGATENLIMAATLAKGKTIIVNAAKEPEIIDLCNFLIKMGAVIEGIGTNTITITGQKKLNSVNHKIIPDRIEAGTFLVAGALFPGKLTLKNLNYKHLFSTIEKLKEIGVNIIKKSNKTIILENNDLNNYNPVKIRTNPYPGFPTDMQAQLMVLLSLIKGNSIISETVFENRFMHVSELLRLGANILIDGHTCIINGVKKLTGARVMATDLRASAALVIAGMVANNQTEIFRVYHIDRGYDSIEKKLNKVGANIIRTKSELI